MVIMEGNDVEIGGFGTFCIITDLKGNRIPVFKCGNALRNVVNENGGNK